MSETIREFAPAKINLALHVLGRRDDGYHELDSIVAFADIGDELNIRAAAEFSISATGRFAADLPAPEDNIMERAWQLARAIAAKRGRAVPPVAIDLVKNLPVASGIGGGSADAAAALRGCLRIAGIALDDDIRGAALQLGADVPVCVEGRACRMRGVGEQIEPLAEFAPLSAVLVNPGVAVATRTVFAGIGLAPGDNHAAAIPERIELAALRNDMSESAMAEAPEIAAVLAAFALRPGVTFARMSGSGATCFAVFEEREAAREAAHYLAALNSRWWIAAVTIG